MNKILRVVLVLLAVVIVAIAGIGIYVKKALPNVGPAGEVRVQATPGRVERGRYLCTNVAACLVCHSDRDTSIYSGPLMAGTLGRGGELFGHAEGLPGDIYASNVTSYHLGNWTDGELFRAITAGVSKDGHALFPLMNYPAYGKLDQEDIYCIIAYLRTLPGITNDVPATQLDFPLNFIVNTIPARAQLVSRPDAGDSVAYGKYLVTMASCVDCHTQADKGKLVAGMEFAGGRDFSVKGRTPLYSANITPDKETGIGNWSRELFIKKFKQYKDSGYVPRKVAAGEANTPMPWIAFAGMEEKDLSAIYTYLQTLKPITHLVQKGRQ
jgi:cytochrome c553